jgi:hypothetical protein
MIVGRNICASGLTDGLTRLNMSRYASKLIFAHTHRYSPVTETVDDGWRGVVVRVHLRVVPIHNLSTARVPDEVDKARGLSLLIAWNGVLGGIADDGALCCSEFAGVVYVALSSVFDDSAVLCGEHVRMGVGGCRVLYVHTLYSYTRGVPKLHKQKLNEHI